jgi:hypothetical protein
MTTDSQKPLKKALSDLALNELQGLKDDGINPTWDQIVQINDLCRKVETPKLTQVSVTGKPERINGRTLWPLTLQAGEWYAWACDELDEANLLIALSYAHEHAREPDAFAELYDVVESGKVLGQYQKGLNVTISELLKAVHTLNDSDVEPVEDSKQVDREEIIAGLVAKTGIPPDYWKNRVSIDYISSQIDAINDMEGDGNAQKSKYIESEKALGRALMEIRKNGS